LSCGARPAACTPPAAWFPARIITVLDRLQRLGVIGHDDGLHRTGPSSLADGFFVVGRRACNAVPGLIQRERFRRDLYASLIAEALLIVYVDMQCAH